MIHHFNKESYSWDGVERMIYKQDKSPFKNVSRQILFNGLGNVPCQLRYFEVEPGGYSTLEHHEHVHLVIIFRGQGQALLGNVVYDVAEGDVIAIEPSQFHQFRANKNDHLGFLCLVNVDRDKVKLPSLYEKKILKSDEAIKAFLEE